MKIRITAWNSKLCEEILCNSEVKAIVDGYGRQVEGRANNNMPSDKSYEGSKGFVYHGGRKYAYRSDRYMGHVYTTDIKSMIAESEHKSLSRAL